MQTLTDQSHTPRQSIKLGPFGFGSKGTGFFTFICVDDQIAVARGQGGGLALWAREA